MLATQPLLLTFLPRRTSCSVEINSRRRLIPKNKDNGEAPMNLPIMKTLSLVAVLLVLTISVFATASTEVINIVTPLTFRQMIPCANQGNGEFVDFSGTLHQLLTSTVNGNNIHLTELSNPQGVKGVGETTGEVWVGTGETRQNLNASVNTFAFETTFVNNFKLVNGNDGSFQIHENTHVTVLADGTTTASIDNFSFTCR
jgi:hypothetical protein